jgi:threonine aldolase
VSLCLSKGLGAPVGSLLCGSAGFIEEARKWRKMVGGGMRQAGILAAGGLYALENNVARLALDHEHADLLAKGLAQFEQLAVERDPAQTNMVFFTMETEQAKKMAGFLGKNNILISPGRTTRLVTHLDISRADISATLETIAEFFQAQ